MYALERMSIRGVFRNPPTRGVRVWSPKSGKDTDSAPPAPYETGASYNQGRQATALTARNKGLFAMLPLHYMRQIWRPRRHSWSSRRRDGRSAPRGGP